MQNLVAHPEMFEEEAIKQEDEGHFSDTSYDKPYLEETRSLSSGYLKHSDINEISARFTLSVPSYVALSIVTLSDAELDEYVFSIYAGDGSPSQCSISRAFARYISGAYVRNVSLLCHDRYC